MNRHAVRWCALIAGSALGFATARVAGALEFDYDPARFVVARLGKGALYAGDRELQALRGEQTTLDDRLVGLRTRRVALGDERYYTEIEPVLSDIAKLDRRIDAREQQLAAASRGKP